MPNDVTKDYKRIKASSWQTLEDHKSGIFSLCSKDILDHNRLAYLLVYLFCSLGCIPIKPVHNMQKKKKEETIITKWLNRCHNIVYE